MSGVVCFWGWDEDKINKAVPWALAQKERYIVVFEQNPLELFRQMIPERVHLIHYDNSNRTEVFREVALRFLFLPFSFSGGEPAEELAQFLEIQQQVLFLSSDVADKGHRLISNFSSYREFFSGEELFGAFKKIPAIICGAGASLNKVASELKSLREGAVIIAAGGGVESLKRFGAAAHFAAQVDPHSAHRYSKTETPVFFQLRADPAVVDQFTGPHLIISGSGSFSLENWLLGSEKPFDGGWTVGTFSAALAYHLGCDPIILAGMDFASEKREAGMISVGSLYSKPDWILASKWLSQFAQDHSERRWIKLKSPSLEMKGFEEWDSRQLLAAPFFSQNNIPALISAALQNLPHMNLNSRWDLFEKSLQVCFTLLDKQMEAIGAYYPKDPRENPRCLEILEMLENEIAYQVFFTPLWEVWQNPVARHNTDGKQGLFLHQMLFFSSLKNSVPLHAAR